jgi:hypothetical protein
VNSSFKVAESRLFPVGNPDLIPQNLISPFDPLTLLQPLINVNIKEKVKDFARNFNSGADYIEDAIRDGWRESPLNPHNFKHLLETPNLFKQQPIAPAVKKPIHAPTSHHNTKAHNHKEKAPKSVETYSFDGLVHDYGIKGYKHFENTILRELEKQEELKVEATIHTLFEHGNRVKSVEIIHGKPYDGSLAWKPVAAPTKNYDDDKTVHSQIASPLHTNIFGGSNAESHDISSDFHDFDHLSGNTVHSTYSMQEEGESKVKPVKAKITSIRKKVKVTPSPLSTSSENSRLNSRYRKRHNNNVLNTVGMYNVVDSGASGSHDAPKIVVKSKRNPAKQQHIQSLTTTKPKYTTVTRHVLTDAPKQEVSTESTNKVPYSHETPARLRLKSSTITSTTTTVKPSRNVQREVPKYVDQTRASGKRGSVKFGQTTTQKP